MFDAQRSYVSESQTRVRVEVERDMMARPVQLCAREVSRGKRFENRFVNALLYAERGVELHPSYGRSSGRSRRHLQHAMRREASQTRCPGISACLELP